MSHDRHQIETIKRNIAEYSSAQLREIAQARNQERWSLEAVVAADELLVERAAGSAQEPRLVKQPPPDPPSRTDPRSLEFLFAVMALGAAAGHVVLPHVSTHDEDTVAADLPLSFGPKVAWLALDTTDTEGVATALGLRGVRAATWVEGIEAAYRSSVFVTPPVADWTLAVGTALFPPDKTEAFVKPHLERLSRQFGDAQYFGTHRDVELHLWARAFQGKLVRGYGWLGEKGLTLWDEGMPTEEERDLGFRFQDRPSAAVEQAYCAKEVRDLGLRSPDSRSPATERAYGLDLPRPDEGCVLRLACLWSIDPTTLGEEFKEPVMGLLGSVAGGKSRTGR